MNSSIGFHATSLAPDVKSFFFFMTYVRVAEQAADRPTDRPTACTERGFSWSRFLINGLCGSSRLWNEASERPARWRVLWLSKSTSCFLCVVIFLDFWFYTTGVLRNWRFSSWHVRPTVGVNERAFEKATGEKTFSSSLARSTYSECAAASAMMINRIFNVFSLSRMSRRRGRSLSSLDSL